jgi:hypothetical protein
VDDSLSLSAWLSAREWLELARAAALVLAHAAAGWCFVTPRLSHALCESPLEASVTASGLARRVLRLGGFVALPCVAASCALVGRAEPQAAALTLRVYWPVVAVMAVSTVACAASLAVAATRIRAGIPGGGMAGSRLAAGSALVAVGAGAVLTAAPACADRWLAAGSLAEALRSGAWIAPFALRASHALLLGALLAAACSCRHGPERAARATRAVAPVAVAASSAAVLATGWSAWTAASPSADAPVLGLAWGASFVAGSVARLGSVAVCACLSAALALPLVLGWLECRARRGPLLALALLAAASLATADLASARALGPWSLPGHLYANGISAERARTFRRSSFVRPGPRPEELGRRMAEAQCAPCHATAGPRGLRSAARALGGARTRELLERLREADQPGHPDRDRMPPLLGADAEVAALAGWLTHGAQR